MKNEPSQISPGYDLLRLDTPTPPASPTCPRAPSTQLKAQFLGMSLDALEDILADLGASASIREVCLYLWHTGEFEALVAVINALAEDTEGQCMGINPDALEQAPPARPDDWAEQASIRILRKLGLPFALERNFKLARYLEEEFERRQAEIVREATRHIQFEDPGFDDDPGPGDDDPDGDLPT